MHIGPLVSWRANWLTHIRLSEELKEAFSDTDSDYQPAHGWYAIGSSELLLGLGISLKLGSQSSSSLSFAFGPRLTPGSLVGITEGFSIAEWPFWFECSWAAKY